MQTPPMRHDAPPPAADAARPIADYAVLGDCRSAALVSTHGSIDWLCWPRFDSPPVFDALLDAASGGRFVVRPRGTVRVRRRYLPSTNVLETVFETETGALRLLDAMIVTGDETLARELLPTHQLVRALECVHGEVDVEVHYAPRFRFGARLPRIEANAHLGWVCADRGRALQLQGDVPLQLASQSRAADGEARLAAGERRYFSLTFADREPLVSMPAAAAARALERTVRFWQSWCATCRYDGPYREAVLRSALVLKLMTYAPSGAVVAAPTTSLPEKIGGVRNWDYRYCWLRDASMTLRAFVALGYYDEGSRFLAWMLHSTRLSWPELHVLYDVYGETGLKERTLDGVTGYANSRPVRVGNEARAQLQLDVYGEVIDAAFEYARRAGRRFDDATQKMLRGFGATVCRRWREPDEGIWETRGGRRHHTFSKAMCWVALDRLIQMHDAGLLAIPRADCARQRAAIQEEIEARGFNREIESYVTDLDGAEVDGSLLLLPYYGYRVAMGRTRSTYDCLRARLAEGPLFYRFRADYRDGLPPGEGSFAACSFWAAECRALHGERTEAREDFEQLLGYANDVGLYAEEIDVASGAALGNFPQAYTHVGLVNAALTLWQEPQAEADKSAGGAA